MNNNIIVIANTDTNDEQYYFEGTEPTALNRGEYIKKYACLSDALEDSEPYRSDDWSDGECLDYVLEVIKQLERR